MPHNALRWEDLSGVPPTGVISRRLSLISSQFNLVIYEDMDESRSRSTEHFKPFGYPISFGKDNLSSIILFVLHVA